MTHTDKEHLAQAYMSAWLAVKRRPCTVTVDSNGWFTVSHQGYSLPDRRRAADLLRGLAVLTDRIVENSKKVQA
jgi:hypothetical protein